MSVYSYARLLQNEEEELDAGLTWQPIYIAVVVTVIQIAVYLLIFEVCRRSPNLAIVYDRRRQSHPERTPPPLMQRRGPLMGWLGFEWWRLSLSKDYLRLSQQEFDKRLEERAGEDEGPKLDEFVIEAERQCREEAIKAVPPDSSISLFTEAIPDVGEQTESGEKEKLDEVPSKITRRLSLRRLPTDVTSGSGESTLDWDAQIVANIFKFISSKLLMMQEDDSDDEMEDRANDRQANKTHLGAADKVHRRPLTAEEKELLRVVGLDAYVTLRFLKFGFDISFWPLILACATLIPVYKTAHADRTGFNSATVENLLKGSGRFWAVVVFVYIQYAFVLRRLWIEWEIFLPLRYDFLEHGDFLKEKYQEQYRNTCLVEYVPRTHKQDKDLYEFFDVLFPGQVRRAEVLLNTETLTILIKERQKHIVRYEDAYAKKVHKRAVYLRDVDAVKKGGYIKRCCRGRILQPRFPREAKIIVAHTVHKRRGNFDPRPERIKDVRTYEVLSYHLGQIESNNEKVDDEFFRLAQEVRHPKQERRKETYIEKWLGLKYLTGTDTQRLHSSTAFVEFSSLTAKQQAIQCNITGTNRFMEVSPVPGINEIIWNNAHVSRALIAVRKTWADVLLLVSLLFWSIAVAAIRSQGDLSRFSPVSLDEDSTAKILLDTYIPVLIIEGLVRISPFYISLICVWVRFKATSVVDQYVVTWYFFFRLVTFIFVIIGGSLVDSANKFVEDPTGFIRDMADQIPEQSLYFATYVIMATGFSSFFYLCQVHNALKHWFIHKIITEEATSSRRLEKLRTTINKFGMRELFPLFVFALMVGLLYGSLAPISNLFVSIFFKLAHKVFKCMFVYIYGNVYEGGGELFYTLNIILFGTIYMMIVLIAGYLSIHGTYVMAGFVLFLLVITAAVHVGVWGTFVKPSKTLALTKARVSDKGKERIPMRQLKKRARAALKAAHDQEEECDDTERLTEDAEPLSGPLSDEEKRKQALEKVRRRYESTGSLDSDAGHFFIYRQPSLNRATWELAPRPYREVNVRDIEFW